MFLQEEDIKGIEEMAALFFSAEDIADNLELTEEEKETFCSNIELKTGKEYTAFRKGRLRTEVELRKAIKMAALNGSSPSQNIMINFFKESTT